jgi:uncharacterized protein with HEPN domain
LPSERPVQRLTDILDNIDWIIEYTQGQSYADFARQRLTRDAVERCLLRISEVARKLEGVIEDIASDQPWSDIRSLGNVIRHEYDAVDPAVIWSIIQADLQPLRQSVEAAIRKLEQER